MTKEELKQKAEEYADKKVEDRKGYNARWELVREAYIAGATEWCKELMKAIQKGTSTINLMIMDNLSKQIVEAKKLLKQWMQTSNASGCDNINIVTDTENFLKE